MMVNLQSLKQDILEEWNDVKDGWNGISQDAKEEFVDIKREWMRMLKKSDNKKSNTKRLMKASFNEKQHHSCSSTNELDLIKQQIRNYEELFQGTDYCLPKLNQTIQDLLPSAKSLIDYYKARPELTHYTITKELRRIKKYTIYTEDHTKLTDPSDILKYQKENNTETNDLLWRCSNQSLLADVIASLTSPTGLIRPQMGAGTTVNDLSLEINFSRSSTDDNNDDNNKNNKASPYVRVECSLNVSIPDNNNNNRIDLACIHVFVYFCPSRQDLKVQVQNITSYPLLKEEEIDRAAKSFVAASSLSLCSSHKEKRTPFSSTYFGKGRWHKFNWNKI